MKILLSLTFFFAFPIVTLAGHETGGGHPDAVRFKLLALRTLDAAIACKVPEALLKPFSFAQLRKTIQTTKLRMSETKLEVDGGTVYAKPEKEGEGGQYRIAVYLPEWKKYPKKSDVIEVEWEVWNIHEYLRVLGLHDEDDTYEVSHEIVSRAKACVSFASPLKFREMHLLTNLETKLYEIPDGKTDTFSDRLPCAAYSELMDGELNKEMNRATVAWYQGPKNELVKAFKEEISEHFKFLDIMISDFGNERIHYAPRYQEHSSTPLWQKCTGGKMTKTMHLIGYYLDEDLENIKTTQERFYFSSHSLKDWTPHNDADAFRWMRELDGARRKADAEARPACEIWKKEMRKLYGRMFRFAVCGLVHETKQTWSEKHNRVGDTYNFSASGTVLWSDEARQ